jgi:hypothetical protein
MASEEGGKMPGLECISIGRDFLSTSTSWMRMQIKKLAFLEDDRIKRKRESERGIERPKFDFWARHKEKRK